LPETGQFDQQPGQRLPVEVISACQQGGQFGAAPPGGGTGQEKRGQPYLFVFFSTFT